ncbi:unnamed protein product [marine sediment metagenome]|uniref:Uncharacterized protein n=1 Tax=marine sediment metagenome TaxID=412755 RepID=X0Z2P9_9ZZZZ
MVDVSEATAAPVPADIHGKPIKLWPLRNMDWGELEQWMRTQVINSAKNATKDPELSLGQRKELMQVAHKSATKISMMNCFVTRAGTDEADAEETAFINTFEGMLRTVHLSMKRETKGLTLAAVDEMLNSSIGLLIELFTTVMRISFPADYSDKELAKNVPAATLNNEAGQNMQTH